MIAQSCGIILWKDTVHGKEFLMCHPTLRNDDVWYFPKGRWEQKDGVVDEKNKLDTYKSCAVREFCEETGVDSSLIDLNKINYLGSIRQRKDKDVHAFGLKCTWDLCASECHSNMFTHKKRNGEEIELPENDNYRWMTYDILKHKTHQKHLEFYKQIINIK